MLLFRIEDGLVREVLALRRTPRCSKRSGPDGSAAQWSNRTPRRWRVPRDERAVESAGGDGRLTGGGGRVPDRSPARVRTSPRRAAGAAARAVRTPARRRAARVPRGDSGRACRRLGIAPFPDEIADRRVEIAGPVDRKMVINALNSGARVFMADFEDANSPTWDNCVDGRESLTDALERTIELVTPEKEYRLTTRSRCSSSPARVASRRAPLRGRWPTDRRRLFDFGLYFLRNHARNGRYLPKLESHVEARLWNDVFAWAQDRLGVPRGDRGGSPRRDDPRRLRDGRDPLRAARAPRPASTRAAGTTSSR